MAELRPNRVGRAQAGGHGSSSLLCCPHQGPPPSSAPQCPVPPRRRSRWSRHTGSLRRPSREVPAWGQQAATPRQAPPSAAHGRGRGGRGGRACGGGTAEGAWGGQHRARAGAPQAEDGQAARQQTTANRSQTHVYDLCKGGGRGVLISPVIRAASRGQEQQLAVGRRHRQRQADACGQTRRPGRGAFGFNAAAS